MKRRLLFIAFLLSCLSVFAQTPEWTSFFNNSTSANEFISDVVFDESDNTYLSGYGNMISGQGEDFLIVKCNSGGTAEWTKTYNGPQNDSDRPDAIFVDDQGNVYVTGTSQFTSNSYKIVTMKYSPAGSLLWRTAYDSLGQSDSRAEDIYVDNNGNILVT
ncbi:MAG: SBBP repeat-containing protein, partial [Ignavibacteriaceae bacterium]|nr:SBBP repeat-containing protein [Ignavibacteriaceae bacterium]